MFIFTHKSDHDGQPEVITTVSTDAVSLSDVVNTLNEFLRGCGFYYNGKLEIVEGD